MAIFGLPRYLASIFKRARDAERLPDGPRKITSGDDVIGMNRAFLYAGTHAIMSSLWRVSDISTALLVKQFYREYKNRPKAESLAQAMRT